MYMITLLDPPKRESVRQLQQTLFPVSNNLDEEDNEESLLAKKDSKELFAVIRDPNSAIQPARWPTECQVIDEEIKHIYYVPPTVEPFYVPTGKEVQPKPVGDKFGLIIYQYYPISAVNYFSRSNVGGSPYLLPTCPCPEEDCLRFESRFESGNLAKVIKITAVYYELYLRNDLYTNKHMQWYYFRVTNMKKNVMYRFSIVNMTKEESLYNDGMRPLLYSTKDAQLHSIGWRRCGDNISYYCNDNPGSEEPDQFPTYTLTFTLEFPHEGDTVYLAYSYPYTYSDLQDYLLELTKHPVKSTYTTLRLLCKTLAGNNLYYVTVTSPQEPNEERKKKAIIVTARVHPGETPSSWMMKGFLDFLTGDTGPAKELREKFIFKLVPMLNPDGVIVGNSRCSLMGTDLNRQYRTVLREAYPSIWYTKLMIRRMIDECGVAMYCDLHAHSRKHNIFVYGCENRRLLDKRLGEQVFPLMLHKNAADKFSFENCLFRIQRCKEGTGRVVMWMMGIANSYTMEASFAGTLMGARAETHFTPQDYEQMGKSFCQTLLDFYDDDPRKERLRTKIIERLMKEGSNAFEPTNIPLSDYSSDDGDSASTSSDEAGREDFTTPLVVPPPSPALTKSKKPKTALAKMRTFAFKNQAVTNEQRKTLPIFTNNIGLTLPRNKSKYTSYSSSNSDSDDSDFKAKLARKRRTKRRTRKQRQAFTKKQTEVEPVEVKSPPRSLSVLDLLPSSKLRSQSWHRLVNPLPPPKPLLDARIPRTTTQQLAEVQAKLVSLKNRLWMVTGQGDANIPLSWGPSKLSDAGSKTTKRTAVISRQKSKIDVRQEKPDKTSVKPQTREASKQKSAQKKQNGLRRQMCVWIPPVDLNNIRKNSSFSDSSIKRGKSKSAVEGTQGCEEEKAKSQNKKKRRKNKLLKKATTVTNVNAFFRKDKD